jgi:hypothetical protein
MEDTVNNRAVRAVAAVVGIFIMLAISCAVLAWWNKTTYPAFAARPHMSLHMPVLHFAPPPKNPGLAPGLPDDPWLLRLTTFMMTRFGRSYASIMGAQVFLYAVFVLIMGALGWRWGGPLAGFFTAGFAAYMPGVLECVIAFDDHLFNMCCVAGAVLLLDFAKGLPGIVPAAAAGFLVGAAMHFSFVPSNGFMALIAVASALAGMHLDEFFDVRRRIADDSEKRSRVAFNQAAIKLWPVIPVFAVVFYFFALRNGSLEYAQYIFAGPGTENTHSLISEPATLLAYPFLLFKYQLDIIISCAALIGIVALFTAPGKGRWTMMAWFFGLIILLSLSPKKNHYYDFYAMIAAAPVAGVGLAAIPRKKIAFFLGVLLVCGAATLSVARLTTLQVNRDFSALFEFFQERPSLFLEAPRNEAGSYAKDAQFLLDTLHARRDPKERILVIVAGSNGLMSSTRYHLTMADPKIQVFVISEFSHPIPRTPRPFFLFNRLPGSKDVPTFEGLIRSEILWIEQMIDGDPDEHGRVQYLQSILAEGALEPVQQMPSFVLYD